MSGTETRLKLTQEQETPLQGRRHGWFTYRYASVPSCESVVAGAPGQDYLALREDGERFAFALCDGVGQSFRGELAAQALGEMLVDWLWVAPTDADAATLQRALHRAMQMLTDSVSAALHAADLPADLPPLVHEVLATKRALGSETTYAAGIFWPERNRIVLAWQGDTRFRLWLVDETEVDPGADAFQTAERWSSRRGPIGPVHLIVAPCPVPGRLLSWSDGLATLDQLHQLDGIADSDDALARLIADAARAPGADDLCLIDLSCHPPRWAPQRR